MSNYENGPGNVPRLPDRVVDTLIDSAGVSRCAPGRGINVVDQTSNVEKLVHDTCEELLARLPTPVSAPTAGERQSIADDPEFNDLLAAFGHNWTEGDKKQAGSRAALIAHIDTLLQGARSAGDAVPVGFKLVPVEPTDEMREACRVLNYADDIDAEWERMLGAAPAPGNTESPTGTQKGENA